jgi:hypothetical protein
MLRGTELKLVFAPRKCLAVFRRATHDGKGDDHHQVVHKYLLRRPVVVVPESEETEDATEKR